MSLQLLRSGAGKCPHTLVPPMAVVLTETLKGECCSAPSLPLPAERERRCLCSLVWVSAVRGHVSLLLWGAWHLAPGSHTHATALLGTTTAEIQKRLHHALCSCCACKVSGSPELPYLLCPIGYIITRLTRAWLLVFPSSFRLDCIVKSCFLFW